MKYYGGAEAMLGVLAHKVLPDADIFTFAYDKEVLRQTGILESRIQSPFSDSPLSNFYREMSLIYPSLIESYLWDKYDNVLSLSYAYVHGLITQPDQKHISFILTPMRLLWLSEADTFWANKIPFVKYFYQRALTSQRLWDKTAAARPDKLISISQEVQSRVKHFWGRDSEIIHPPVDVDYYRPKEKQTHQDYYVTHARLVRHKRIDLIIKACEALNKKLIIIGDGPLHAELSELVSKKELITFAGFLPDDDKRFLLQHAKGYIFAANEDFGMSPVEAIASNIPVLAYNKGGVRETIQENINGLFFDEQTVESLVASLKQFDTLIEKGHFSEDIAQTVTRFGVQQFVEQSKDLFIA